MYMSRTKSENEDWATYHGLKTDEEIKQQPAVYFAELLGLKNIHVITLKGLTKVDEYDYVSKKYKNEQLDYVPQ